MMVSSYGGAASPAAEGLSGISGVLAGLPPWLFALLCTSAVLLAAAVAGHLLGRVYCAVRYPDPDKRPVLSTRQRFVFLGLLIAICAVLISAFSSLNGESATSVDNMDPANAGGKTRGGGGVVVSKY